MPKRGPGCPLPASVRWLLDAGETPRAPAETRARVGACERLGALAVYQLLLLHLDIFNSPSPMSTSQSPLRTLLQQLRRTRWPFSAGLSLPKFRSAGDQRPGLRHFSRNLVLCSAACPGGALACGPARWLPGFQQLAFSPSAPSSCLPPSYLLLGCLWLFSAEPPLPRIVAGAQGMSR